MLRRIVQFASVCGAVMGVGVVGAGCLDCPVTSSGATTKTNFTASVTQNAIDKVDILFDIDNSASMGDKQELLAKAVPDLVTRLVQPNCVSPPNAMGVTMVVGQSSNGTCTSGTIEFQPVHNMHIGVISSSLGTRGVVGSGAVCDPTTPGNGQSVTPPFNDPGMHPAISAHVDDRGELLNRTATDPYTEGTSPDTGGQNFLDWFPTGTGWTVNDMKTPNPPGFKQATGGAPAVALLDSAKLETDFQNLIVGSHYYGCGIESQLESWYRFLVQPDPYESIALPGGHAQWSGVDATIIKQRHDFLRPDSLVAIIDLSDEDDSEIDVRSFGQQGWEFMSTSFQPPRGTSKCSTSPSDPACTSCAYGGATASDPACKLGKYMNPDDPGFYINVRHVHMKQKYGIVPQFPLGRYVLGLTSPKVPDRNHEYPGCPDHCVSSYAGGTVYDTSKSPATLKDPQDLNCTNPLFATTLPDGSDLSQGGSDGMHGLCNLAGGGGGRTADLIFYAHIGGVPHQLLQAQPGDPTCPTGTPATECPQKDTLAATDWVKILGQGWESIPSPPAAPNQFEFNYSGIDSHMIESFQPRPGLVALGTGPNPMGGGADAINGGEWKTDGTSPTHSLPVDREYACIFPLVDPTTGTPTPRDCSVTGAGKDYAVSEACDCATTGLAPDAVPAVCGLANPGAPYASGTNDYTQQFFAKAYPTTREIQLVELMGSQGILSSLCPIHTSLVGGASDPLFGYRPAITAIVNRLKNALATQCLPQHLTPVATVAGTQNCDLPVAKCEVPCLVLATLALTPANVIANESKVCNDAAAGLRAAGEGLSGTAAQTEVDILKTFQKAQHASFLAPPNSGHGTDPSLYSTCLVEQIPYDKGGSCASGTGTGGSKGWCYVTDPKFTGTCTQAVQFTQGSPPEGSVVSLQCIEGQVNAVSGSDGGGG